MVILVSFSQTRKELSTLKFVLYVFRMGKTRVFVRVKSHRTGGNGGREGKDIQRTREEESSLLDHLRLRGFAYLAAYRCLKYDTGSIGTSEPFLRAATLWLALTFGIEDRIRASPTHGFVRNLSTVYSGSTREDVSKFSNMTRLDDPRGLKYFPTRSSGCTKAP